MATIDVDKLRAYLLDYCGTAMFSDPSAPLKIIEGLRRWCSDNGVGSVRELTGSVVTG